MQREGKYFSTKKNQFCVPYRSFNTLETFLLSWSILSFILFLSLLLPITYYYYYYYYKIVINIRRPLISTTFRHFSITFQSQLINYLYIDSKLIFEIMNENTS